MQLLTSIRVTIIVSTIVVLNSGMIVGCEKEQSKHQSSVVVDESSPPVAKSVDQEVTQAQRESDARMQLVLPIELDPEQEVFPSNESVLHLGSWTVDRSAYVGLPRILADNATQFISQVLEIVGLDNAPTRVIYKRIERPRGAYKYPIGVDFIEIGPESVPIILLPSPDLLRSVQKWAEFSNWEDVQRMSVFDSLDWEDTVTGKLGRTIFFVPGRSSEAPIRTPALPDGTQLSAGIFLHSSPHLTAGKIVFGARDHDVDNVLEPLNIGSKSGATMTGRITVVSLTPENERLRMVHLESPGQQSQSWIAYALADANGARRSSRHVMPDGTSSFERPLSSPSHDPKLGRHSLLRIPKPLDLQTRSAPHEELSLDEWFFRNNTPGVLLSVESGSMPFRESLVIGSEPNELSPEDKLHLIALFPDTPPEEIVQFMLSVSGSSLDEIVLQEKLVELNKLYKAMSLLQIEE